MRGAAILLVGLLSGCVTKALWSTSPAGRPHPEPAGKAECELDLAAPAPGSRSLSFAVAKPVPKAPKRMSIEMARGRTCLLLRRPLALGFAGPDLLEGRTAFTPERVTVGFAQTRTKQGTRRSPALLQIEGPVPEEFRFRIERCEDPEERQPLDDVVDQDVRMQLGHAIDTLVAMVTDVRPSDVVAWRAVEGPGDWRDALDEAHRTCSVAPLLPYRVVTRVWRNGGTSCYRMRLEDVVLAANITFRGRRYEWNGLWTASLELPEGPARASVKIPARLEYAEYKQEGKSAMADIWRVLLTPAALAADLGLAGAATWAEDWLESQDEETSITRPRK